MRNTAKAVTWTPEMRAWLAEVVARMPEPTVRQLDTVKDAFRQAALAKQVSHSQAA
ncbi:hypothetical protein P3H15_32810 [Rhodococcus sp. T2V]|uniref:hypothetical protein n=1 Tax=Rhodococcus sp. T2V TaxID=3034164 RepID=UPI0023E33571|nr:hypothetical protein [Rhodococcus sp. T2V]MDF3309802.1 hypothetical protein [Rhodococcus sp. T2V]